MPRTLQVFSIALVGALAAGCADAPSVARPANSGRPTGPIPPYTVRAAELDESSGPKLAEALRGIDGVESVELDVKARKAKVQTKADRFLYEPQVQAAFASASVELTSFEAPSEAFVTVYVVDAAGGG